MNRELEKGHKNTVAEKYLYTVLRQIALKTMSFFSSADQTSLPTLFTKDGKLELTPKTAV